VIPPYRWIIPNPGGPETIERADFSELPSPAPGEVLLQNRAIGVNYIDIYHRTGLYPRSYPCGIGQEAAGVVTAVGPGVDTALLGVRAGCTTPVDGTYATHSLVSVNNLFPLPDLVSDEIAAAALLKGLTAWMLIEKCALIAPGQAVLVTAASGGVGSILVQWLHAIGAVVIAHSGSAEKAAQSRALGADHALHCAFDELAIEVRRLTGGKGVAAVLDGVGKDSWTASLDSLATRGIMVSFGNASGAVSPFTPLDLARRGSLSVVRPTLGHFIEAPAERKQGAEQLFSMIETGAVRINIGQRFPLTQAADALRALEARQTTGSTILIV
jgi:NADPH:quinone reductase